MRQMHWLVAGAVTASLSLPAAECVAQAKVTAVPDAQVESNVLKALAADPKVADQTITSNTVYGTVTLTGTVRDEDSRKLAENIVSRTPGVQKVVDELTLGAGLDTAAGTQTPDNAGGTNPLLQSDGTLAQPGQDQQTQPAQQSQAQPAQQPAYDQQGPPPSQNQQQQPTYGQQPYNQQQPPYSQQPYGSPQQPGPYGPQYRQPYAQPPVPQAGYTQQPPPGAQPGGLPVTVPAGSMLRIRINQGLDSKHTQPGTVFDAVVLNDVVADGYVAIPRGASVRGTVVESQKAGALKGRGELALQLTQVTLAGRTYPIVSDVWTDFGPDKTAHTVNNALGLGVVGAIIGGVAGGGAGAAVGAGIGGAAGVGTSAASGGGQAFIPAEAILTFHITQQAPLTTVSQAEMDRLGYGVPVGAQMRRRYAQPPPYGYPVYYPRYPYAY